jgi:PKD repeat protein/Leucine-rich repeat (LRR) protein
MKKVFKIFLLLLIAMCCNRSVSAQTAAERQVLEVFYATMDGTNWVLPVTGINNKPWTSSYPVSQWYGVQITDDHVTGIDLDGGVDFGSPYLSTGPRVGLKGATPASTLASLNTLGSLTSLTFLSLSGNSLLAENPIPANFANLPNLQYLLMSNCNLTGSIPSFIGNNLRQLRGLTFEVNKLTGPIPTNFNNLINLQYLYLNANGLTGGLPTNLGSLQQLIVMNIGNNPSLGGVIPPDWVFPNMSELHLQNDSLSGGIPPNIAINYPNLTWLLLSNNPLGGPIPSNLGNLTGMQYLGLHTNLLTGSLPNLSGMNNAIEIVLSNNFLTGTIPPTFNSSPSLYKLFLHLNQLEGDIPSFANLTGSREINVSHNKFIFDNMEGDTWATSPNRIYSPQAKIRLRKTNCVLSDTSIPSGERFNWYQPSLPVTTITTSNTFTATQTGMHRCEITHPNFNLLTLVSNDTLASCAPACCEKAVIQTSEPCCSQLKLSCPIKSVKVSLTNGTFIALNGTCVGTANGSTGLSSYTLTPQSTCDSSVIYTCFKATGTGAVGISYLITFADGTTCTKEEKKDCPISCCEKAVITPTQEKCCSQIKIDCPVRSVKVTLTGGTFTSLDGNCLGLPRPSSYIGLNTYTVTPDYSACIVGSGIDINACFKATGSGQVIITYFITFADGTTCIKEEKKDCPISCCDKALINPITDQCRSQLQITGECAVKSIKIELIGGKFTTFSSTCGNPNVTGLTSFVINPTTTCTNAFFAPYFQATGLGTVTVTYTVTFTDGTTCVKSETKKCCCTPKVTVPTTGCKGVALPFKVDTTCKYINGKWSFGDGTSSSIANTTHVYNTVGSFTATFSYTNDCGTFKIPVRIVIADCCCEKAVIARPKENACCSQIKIDCPVKSVQIGLVGGVFTNIGSSCLLGLMDVEGLETVTLNYPAKCPSQIIDACFMSTGNGLVTITYSITFADGTTCIKTQTQNCCCTPKITAPTTGCAGLPVKFSLEGNCKFEKGTWYFGDGTSSNEINTTHTYNLAGGYGVTFYYVDACGEHKISYDIKIEDCKCYVKPCIYVKPDGLVAYFSGHLSTSNYPIASYHWDFGDGTWANGMNPIHTYAKSGSYKVCLTVYADNGENICECVEKTCMTIEVKEGHIWSNTSCEYKPTAPPASSSNSNTNATSLKMSVFPNPVNNNLTVVFDKKLSDTEGGTSQLELYNLQGQLIKQQPLEAGFDETKVSMQQLPVGVYMISLRQNGQIISTVKVTKN